MGAVLRNAVCYFRKIPRWWEECDAMAVGLVGSNYTRGAANTVVEKRSEIIDAIATEASLFDGGPPTKVDQRFSPISASTPRPLPRPLPPSSPPLFFRKITHDGHLFVCSARLLARKLTEDCGRPTFALRPRP